MDLLIKDTRRTIAMYAGKHVSNKHKLIAEEIAREVGIARWIDKESQTDSITALSGNGPAYFFLLMEALQEATEELGIDEENSTLQTALGASTLAYKL